MAGISAGNNKKKNLDFCNRCHVSEPAPDKMDKWWELLDHITVIRYKSWKIVENFLASCHVTPLPRSYVHNDFKESLGGSFRRYLNQNIPDITPLIKMDINSHAYYLFSQLLLSVHAQVRDHRPLWAPARLQRERLPGRGNYLYNN